ncbi:hypothetical protein BKI52_43325 [marine bacterium AO1-C]|nr:hypothetical protein BKI52_43325 [marine bacterium AO1-C]
MKQQLLKTWTTSVFLAFLITNLTQAQPFRGCASGSERVPAVNAAFEKEILRLVNIERKKRGLRSLTWNEKMARAARYHAADMAHDDYFNHASFDKGGKQVCATFARIRKFGSGSAENIAAGGSTPAGTMRQWMNSPGHKKNILSVGAKSLGVGYYSKTGLRNKWRHYWVQNFSRETTNGRSGGSSSGGNSGSKTGKGRSKLSPTRSYRSNAIATLEIRNRTKGMLKGYWVDYKGREQFYFNLAPGKSHKQPTATKNLWIIKNAQGRVVRKIFMKKWFQLISIGRNQRGNGGGKMIRRNRSFSSTTKATLKIANRTPGKLMGYWVDQKGRERYYFTINQGETYTQNTFTKHLWRIKNARGKVVRRIFMKKQFVNRVIK